MPRLLALIPHPDDESYSFAGTLALAARAGWECLVVCASKGEKGKRHDGGAPDRQSVADVREHELETSCRALGVQPPTFWGLPDGGMRLAGMGGFLAAGEMSRIQPDIVCTLGADGAYGHPDHLALHQWVVEAWPEYGPDQANLVFPVFPRGLFLPQYEKCMGMMGDPPNPPRGAIGSDAWDYEVPIASVREAKLAAISAHRSQLPGGDPAALFPPGIVRALLEVERFHLAGPANETVERFFADVGGRPRVISPG